VNRNLISRVRKIEQRTFQPRWRVVVKDYDGLYGGECGEGLSQVQFDAWVKQQEKDTQIIVVEVCVDKPPAHVATAEQVTFKVENHADKNTMDLLNQYNEVLRKQEETNNGKENHN
jgi:hypothetical protein